MRVSMVVAAVLSAAMPSHAGPAIGTTMTYGESLGGEAGERVSANVYAYSVLGGGLTLGGEVSGSLEGYTGGYGCGTTMGGADVDVPAVAVVCFQPSVGTHLLVGTQASPSSWSQLRLELGVGATALYLMAGDGGHTSIRRGWFARCTSHAWARRSPASGGAASRSRSARSASTTRGSYARSASSWKAARPDR
jgi:hypothetical protein